MVSFLPFSVPACVGLDVQSHGVRLVECSKLSQLEPFKRAVCHDFSTAVWLDGQIQWANLQAELSAFRSSLKLHRPKTVLSLPLSLVKLQQLQLPLGLNEHDILQEIYRHLQEELIDAKELIAVDFNIRQAMVDSIDVVFAATRREYLTQYVACVNAAGFSVKIVDIDVYAIKRALNYRQVKNKTTGAYAILYLTMQRALFMVIENDQFVFQQHAELTSSSMNIVEIKQWLLVWSMNVATIAVETLYVCGAALDVLDVQSLTVDLAWQIEVMDPFFAQAEDYWLAAGLALREMPAW